MTTTRSYFRNVVLTGFMGTGKSVIGAVIASRLGLEWVDTDELIESRHGPIPEIFAADGEEAFRELERGVAGELALRTGLVISTGGRMMLDRESASLLAPNNRVFCLVASAGEVLSRVSQQDGPPRPLLANAHPADRIAELMAERAEGYSSFEQVSTDGKTVEDVADEVVQRLNS